MAFENGKSAQSTVFGSGSYHQPTFAHPSAMTSPFRSHHNNLNLNTPPGASNNTSNFSHWNIETPIQQLMAAAYLVERSPLRTTPRPRPQASPRPRTQKSDLKYRRRILSTDSETGETPNVSDNEDDIVMLSDQGKNRLFPNEPELSFEFKEYLMSLSNQDPEKIKCLAQDPPIMTKKYPDWPKSTSHCFITTDDLTAVQEEIGKIGRYWSEDEKEKVQANKDDCTIQLLSLHEYLISHVLAAKERCIGNVLKKSGNRKPQPNGMPLIEGLEVPEQIKTEEVGHSLFWQAGVFRDLYRQTLMTPFLLEKRKRELGLPLSVSTGRKRKVSSDVPQASTVPRQNSSTSKAPPPESS